MAYRGLFHLTFKFSSTIIGSFSKEIRKKRFQSILHYIIEHSKITYTYIFVNFSFPHSHIYLNFEKKNKTQTILPLCRLYKVKQIQKLRTAFLTDI